MNLEMITYDKDAFLWFLIILFTALFMLWRGSKQTPTPPTETEKFMTEQNEYLKRLRERSQELEERSYQLKIKALEAIEKNQELTLRAMARNREIIERELNKEQNPD